MVEHGQGVVVVVHHDSAGSTSRRRPNGQGRASWLGRYCCAVGRYHGVRFVTGDRRKTQRAVPATICLEHPPLLELRSSPRVH